MYMNCACLPGASLGVRDKTKPLLITSCGTYRLQPGETLPTQRPKGRIDYQLLYIASGKGYFYLYDEEPTEICAGHFILYRPGQRQRYYYYGNDHTEVFWMHFTGSAVSNMLRTYGIPDSLQAIHTGTSAEYNRICTKMISEMQLGDTHTEQMLCMYLEQLLILLQRQLTAKKKSVSTGRYHEMESAIQYFHSHYPSPLCIQTYAADHGMSVSGFIRTFRQYTGTTPAHFVQTIRMRCARTLLDETDYPVATVSRLVGYDNPLYFSRIFKKCNGVAPSRYRSRNIT